MYNSLRARSDIGHLVSTTIGRSLSQSYSHYRCILGEHKQTRVVVNGVYSTGAETNRPPLWYNSPGQTGHQYTTGVSCVRVMDLFDLSDDEEEAIIIALFLLGRRRRRRFIDRKTWMHPLTAERLSVGQYYTIMHRLRQDNGTKFYDFFRMSQQTFDELLNILRPHIEKKDTRDV